MTVYSRQIENSLRIIRERGQSVTWVSQTNTTAPDPTEPWNPSENLTVSNTVTIVFLPVGYRGYRQQQYAKDSEVQTGRIYGIMGSVDFTPSLKDYVVRGTENLKIATIDPIAPDGTPIIYEIEFSK